MASEAIIMEDTSILHHIQNLVDEEHRLDQQGDRSPADHERDQRLKVELDQCWDLRRQRRARRQFGDDPDQERVQAEKTVESYEQ